MEVTTIGKGLVVWTKTMEAEVTEELYGPWMTVTNKKTYGRLCPVTTVRRVDVGGEGDGGWWGGLKSA